MAVAGSARRSAHRAARSDTMRALARAGLAGHGVIWVLIGVLAAVMAFGGRGEETDQRGALEELAQHNGGSILLLVLAIGLAAYALWRLFEAVTGTAGDAKERVASLVRAVIYASLATSAVEILVSGRTSSQKKQQQNWTARIMANDGGRWLIGLVGLVVLGVGIYLIYQGVSKKVLEDLDLGGLAQRTRGAIEWCGIIGSAARGVVVGLAGILVLVAAINYDPKKASGVDGALRTVRDASAGPVLLVVVALGLILFGVFGVCEAKFRRV